MNKKILIIDDDEAILEAIGVILQFEGYDIETNSKGDYFDEIPSGLPDLVLLDILLPGRDGKVICQHIKATPATAHLPVVLLSAYTNYEVEKMAQEAGADHFLTKPFDVHELVLTVKRFIDS